MSAHLAHIFAEGVSAEGTLAWGWQCTCGVEDTGFGNATTAQESADSHEADHAPTPCPRCGGAGIVDTSPPGIEAAPWLATDTQGDA